MERTQGSARARSKEGGQAENKASFTGAERSTPSRERGRRIVGPGGGLWLFKCALVVTLLVVLLLLTVPGPGLG